MSKYQVMVYSGNDFWKEVLVDAECCRVIDEGELYLYAEERVVAIFARDSWQSVIHVDQEKGCCSE